jgi:hypothetical protein
MRDPEKRGMAAECMESGFYARSPAKDVILDRSNLTFPARPPEKQGSRLSILMALAVMLNASAKLA